MIKNMGRVSTHGVTDVSIQANGKMESSMAKAFIDMQMDIVVLESGQMAKEQCGWTIQINDYNLIKF